MMDTKVEWVSSSLVRPSSIVKRLSLTRFLIIFIDLVLRILLTIYLSGLIGENFGIKTNIWSQVSTPLLIDFLSFLIGDKMPNNSLLFVGIGLSYMLSSLSPTLFFYIAWLVPKHIIGQGLKVPLNKGATEEPLYLSYDLLTEIIKSDHGNSSLFLLALKELYCRILYQDLDKSITTDKFFT